MGLSRGTTIIAGIIILGMVGIVAFHIVEWAPAPEPEPVSEPAEPEPLPEPGSESVSVSDFTPEPESVAPEEVSDARIYGTVLDAASGTPIEGARIFPVTQLLTYDEPDRALDRSDGPVSFTDEAGAYEITPPEGSWRHLICIADGYARAVHPYQVGAGRSVRVDFLMEPGGQVTGRVVDARTGEGIEDAMVAALGAQQSLTEMMFSQGEEGIYQAYADADGQYTLEGLPVGAYRISVQARRQGYIFPPENTVNLDLRNGQRHEGVDFRLERGAVVEGRVVGPNNEPVPRASVNVVPGQLFQTVLDTLDTLDPGSLVALNDRTDDDGRFRIAGLDYDWPFRLRCAAANYAELATDLIRIRPGESPHTMTITLSRGARVAGIAQFEDGEPATEHQIRLIPDAGALTSGRATSFRSTATDADGAFLFEAVGSGRYNVAPTGASPLAAFTGGDGGVRIEVDGATAIDDLELIVRRPAETPEEEEPLGDGVIDGEVLDPDGGPAPSVRVEARLRSDPSITSGTTTNEEGRFQLTQLRGALYDLSVVSDLGVGEAAGIAVGSRATIRLTPPSHIRGIVTDAHGEPAPSTRVTLERQDRDSTAQPMAILMRNVLGGDIGGQTTNPAGFFEFRNVTPGEYVVRARSSALGAGASQSVSVTPGARIDDLRIVLDAGVRFGGTVINTNGATVSGASIRLMPAAVDQTEDFMSLVLPAGMQQTAGTAVSDGQGRFEIDQVPPGNYTIIANHTRYARYHQPSVSIPAGRDTLNFRIVLGEGAEISGEFTVDGEPREGAVVQMLGRSGLHMLTTDSSGRVDFSGIPEGSYLVSAMDPSDASPMELLGLSMTPRVIDIANGDRTHIDLGPREGGASVSGFISGLDSNGIITVSLRAPGGPAPEEVNLMDLNGLIEAARYLSGQAFVGADGGFAINGVEPGEYILEVMSLNIDPRNPDIGRLLSMDRTPQYRQTITVGDDPLDLNINLSNRQ